MEEKRLASNHLMQHLEHRLVVLHHLFFVGDHLPKRGQAVHPLRFLIEPGELLRHRFDVLTRHRQMLVEVFEPLLTLGSFGLLEGLFRFFHPLLQDESSRIDGEGLGSGSLGEHEAQEKK